MSSIRTFVWIVSEVDGYNSRNHRTIGVFSSINHVHICITRLFKTDIMSLENTKDYLNGCLNPRYTVCDHTNNYAYSIVRHDVE